MRRMIAIETHHPGRRMGAGWGAAFGAKKTVRVDMDWLKQEIAPKTLDEFLSTYTADEARTLYRKYRAEMYQQSPHDKKVNAFLEELAELSEKHGIWVENFSDETVLQDEGQVTIARDLLVNWEDQEYGATLDTAEVGPAL